MNEREREETNSKFMHSHSKIQSVNFKLKTVNENGYKKCVVVEKQIYHIAQ